MDEKVAKYICSSALRCSSFIGQILPFAKANCSEEEYKDLLFAVAKLTNSINEDIMEPILEKHPILREEIEASVSRYGVFI